MLFNSFEFGFFFVVVTLAYYVLPHHYRWFLLLAASCYFYMVFVPIYILILLVTILVDYFAGIYIEAAQGPNRKLFLILSIITNAGILMAFKYFNFINGNVADLAKTFILNYPIENLSILLPIGLSFHTFQSLSYTIEVYRGRQKAERHLGIFALYVMFYPQLVAGPIERPQHMLHQFYERHTFNYENFTSGLRLIAWGLFKKVVIADRLALIVNAVYSNPRDHNGFDLIIATYCFAFQIYCDFSGYSDIAVGCARVMGFKLMDNFHQPYLANSITEFWRRWHISLSTWFRDYLYIPLGGNRVTPTRFYMNTLMVFVVSGVWHGANWTFILWGMLHGLYAIFTNILSPLCARLVSALPLKSATWFWNTLQVFVTFHLVCFAWIFFRASTVNDAWYIATNLFANFQIQTAVITSIGGTTAFVLGVSILLMGGGEWLFRSQKMQFRQLPVWLRWSSYYVLVMLIVHFGVVQSQSQFIYFQF